MHPQRNKSSKNHYSQITATVSVALVLTLVGLIAMTALTVHALARQMEEEVGYTVVLSDSVTNAQAQDLGSAIKRLPSTANVTFRSAEQVLARWQEMAGADSILSLTETNPFLPEWDVTVKPSWASPDSLRSIARRLTALDMVEQVSCRDDQAKVADATVTTVTTVLAIVAAVLGLISFFLISNAIRLSVYARRHSIHAMRLVGAKNGFIRRPFLVEALLSALMAATAASAIIAAAYYYLISNYAEIALTLPLEFLLWTIAGIFVAGIIICLMAALFSTNRYLRTDAGRLV